MDHAIPSREGNMLPGQGTRLEGLLAKAREDPDVLAVFLFGSAARGEEGPRSDVDVCLVLTDAAADNLAASRKRLDYMAASDLDVRVFQRVPLYIRHRILKEGRLLFSRDEDLVYELAVRTAREFERFKPIYREYLEQVARAGS